MGPCRNTTAMQAENAMNVKPNRHNIRGNILKNVTTQHPYYFLKLNYNNAPNNNNNNTIIATAYTLAYTNSTYNVAQPVVMTNYAYAVQPIQQIGINHTIHAAKEAGYIDRLEEYYTKCRLITMFQIKGNYLRLHEVVEIYFNVYHRALVYEGSLKEVLNLEMNQVLSLIEIDGKIIIRLCEPFQMVRNDILIISINFEYEVDSYDIIPDKCIIKESISKVTEWLKNQMDFASDEEEISIPEEGDITNNKESTGDKAENKDYDGESSNYLLNCYTGKFA